MGVDEWKINNQVKVILSKNWIDVPKLLVTTVRNTVCIKGELSFTGGRLDEGSEQVVGAQLRKVEREILALRNVRHVDWRITGWRKTRNRWEREGVKGNQVQEKKEQ